MKHEPALDGLRGVAVAGVVAFHAGWARAGGGFLGVSTFFTLSGFLITSLLLRERRDTGRIDLPAFWGRRACRLLPAAMVTLAGVAALAPALATADQLVALRGDVLAAVLYAANWRFVLAGRSYADLFALPSPVLHFWSLAIEEQLYVVVPLLVFAVRRHLAAVLGALVVASVALGWVLYRPGHAITVAYYSTGVRAGELLVGALLAVLVLRADPFRFPAAKRVMAAAGVLALAALLWAWSSVTLYGTALYRGGFVLHAVASAAVVAAALVPGPVRRLLSAGPLRALGRISYGVYLYHWPVFVWVDEPAAVEIAIAVAIAIVSYHLVEQPIRQRRWRMPVVVAPAAAAAVAAMVVVATLDPPRPMFPAASAEPKLAADEYVAPAAGAPRVAVFGDSTALRTAFALKGWGWNTGRIDMVDGDARVGCALGRGGVIDWVVDQLEADPACDEWPSRWRDLVVSSDLDVALVQVGPWEVTNRELEGATGWTHIGDPAHDAYLEGEVRTAVDVLSAGGALVVWLTSPQIEFGRGQANIPRGHPISDAARMARLNQLIANVDAARDEMVVLDLAGHLRSLPGGEMDPRLRPDGVHFSEEASAEIAQWLGPALIDLAPRVD